MISSFVILKCNCSQTLCITYASEVCPVALRGFLTGYVNFCWGAGQCLSLGILKAFLNRDDEWAYRIPYGLQVSVVISYRLLCTCF